MSREDFDQPYAGVLDLPPGVAVTDDEANEGRVGGDPAATAPHLLLSGRTGSRKTRSVLAANVNRWGARPVVAVSSKGDLAELTIRERAKRGPVFLLDLSAEVRDSELKGVDVTRVYVDPTALITSDDDALRMANTLIEIGTLGAGDGGADAFWGTLAARPLAAMLRAGWAFPHPDTGKAAGGGGVRWVLDAVESVGPDELPEADYSTPNWNTAYLRCRQHYSKHASSLLAAKDLDPRQRDSIGINMRVALTAWGMDTVTDDDGKMPFHPSLLAAPGATLYIVSPGGADASAPIASLTLMEVVRHWRKRVGQLEPVLFVIDELANGSPIPPKTFLSWIGEGRGLGIRVVAGVQASSQFSTIWDEASLKVLRDIFPAVLVLPGSPEDDYLEAVAKRAGMRERTVANVGPDGKTSYSRERAEVMTLADLLPKRIGEGRLILSGMPGVAVKLPDLSRLSFE